MIQNTFHYLYLPPLTLQAINIVKIKRPVVGGGGGVVATNFNVSSRIYIIYNL